MCVRACVCVCVCVCVCAEPDSPGWGEGPHAVGRLRGQDEVSLSLCVVVQSLNCVRLFATLQTATLQAPLSFTLS